MYTRSTCLLFSSFLPTDSRDFLENDIFAGIPRRKSSIFVGGETFENMERVDTKPYSLDHNASLSL